MIDYSKSKIFIIRSEDCYHIGGTTNTLSRCKVGYKVKCAKDENSKLSKIVHSYFCNISLLEYFPCETKKKLNRRVRQCRREYKIKLKKDENDRSIFNLSLLD